jgi:hypothetical protein
MRSPLHSAINRSRLIETWLTLTSCSIARWSQTVGPLGLLALIVPLLASNVALGFQADEASMVELRVPLLRGTYYRPRDLAGQYQKQFGDVFDLDSISDVPRRLTVVEWASLRAAHFAGWLEFEQHDDELILRFPILVLFRTEIFARRNLRGGVLLLKDLTEEIGRRVQLDEPRPSHPRKPARRRCRPPKPRRGLLDNLD